MQWGRNAHCSVGKRQLGWLAKNVDFEGGRETCGSVLATSRLIKKLGTRRLIIKFREGIQRNRAQDKAKRRVVWWQIKKKTLYLLTLFSHRTKERRNKKINHCPLWAPIIPISLISHQLLHCTCFLALLGCFFLVNSCLHWFVAICQQFYTQTLLKNSLCQPCYPGLVSTPAQPSQLILHTFDSAWPA